MGAQWPTGPGYDSYWHLMFYSGMDGLPLLSQGRVNVTHQQDRRFPVLALQCWAISMEAISTILSLWFDTV